MAKKKQGTEKLDAAITVKLTAKTKAAVEARLVALGMNPEKDKGEVGRWLFRDFSSTKLPYDQNGNLSMPTTKVALPPPPPQPDPEPEPDWEPLPEVLPPMPAEDYLGLSTVAFYYRNRNDGETYERFLAAFDLERRPEESMQMWAYRTRQEEQGGAA